MCLDKAFILLLYHRIQAIHSLHIVAQSFTRRIEFEFALFLSVGLIRVYISLRVSESFQALYTLENPLLASISRRD